MIIFEGRNGLAQVRCLAGCDPIDIIEVLRERGLWGGGSLTLGTIDRPGFHWPAGRSGTWIPPQS